MTAPTRMMVPRGLVPTPFHARVAPLNHQQNWIGWQGFATAGVLESVDLEYSAIRNTCTLYDLSPMRTYRINGPDAERVMNRLVTRDVRRLAPGRAGYALWCDEDGMVIEDGAIFRLGPQDFLLTCQERQFSWLHDIAWGFDAAIADESDALAGLALQGPTSFAVLEAAGLGVVAALKPFDHVEVDGVLISRTGYTGDLGYELFVPAVDALALWDRLWAAGRVYGIRAIGSAALDIARIEAGFIATGHDYVSAQAADRHTRRRTPFELGLGRFVTFDKPHFNGRRALKAHKAAGPRTVFAGLDVEGAKPAAGALVYHRGKQEVGRVVAACWSPAAKRNIAIAELRAPFGVTRNDRLSVEIYHQKELKWEVLMAAATITERPFFRTARRTAMPPGRT